MCILLLLFEKSLLSTIQTQSVCFMKRPLLLLLSLWLLSSCTFLRNLTQKDAVSINQEAELTIEQGKQLLRAKKYPEALDAFAMASEGEWHRSTTAAIYLAGLAAHQAGYDDVAEDQFDRLKREFPESRYIEDADYHLAIADMRSRYKVDQREGIKNMLQLAVRASTTQLRVDAIKAVQADLYGRESLREDEWQALYASAPEGMKVIVLEPWLAPMIQAADYEQVRARYQAHVDAGGTSSDYLEDLLRLVDERKAENSQLVFEPNISRIALMMPFHWNEPEVRFNNDIPSRAALGLEFYEGFRIAVEGYMQQTGKQVFLRPFDSRRDTFKVREYLNQLSTFNPTLIVGDLYNTESGLISGWAEEKQIPQVVPLSATKELVEGKSYTFLAHPAANTHGQRLAEHAFYNLSLTRVAVFTNNSRGTKDLAEGFMSRFNELGGTIDTLFISLNYDLAVKEIPDLVGQIVDDGSGVGVYIPLMGDEESAGLIINLLRQKSIEVVVMGSPHFRTRYNTLSRDIKERYQVLFTTSHLHDDEDPSYKLLYDTYLKQYKYPPTDNVIQGYDLARYLLAVLETYDPTLGVSLDTYLRTAPSFEGLHINYHFDGKQSNQSVNIGQYLPVGIIKVN